MVAVQDLMRELGFSKPTMYRRIKMLGLETSRQGREAYLTVQDAQALRLFQEYQDYHREATDQKEIEGVRGTLEMEESQTLYQHYLVRYIDETYVVDDPRWNRELSNERLIQIFFEIKSEAPEKIRLRDHCDLRLSRSLELRRRWLRHFEKARRLAFEVLDPERWQEEGWDQKISTMGNLEEAIVNRGIAHSFYTERDDAALQEVLNLRFLMENIRGNEAKLTN